MDARVGECPKGVLGRTDRRTDEDEVGIGYALPDGRCGLQDLVIPLIAIMLSQKEHDWPIDLVALSELLWMRFRRHLRAHACHHDMIVTHTQVDQCTLLRWREREHHIGCAIHI